MSMRRAVVTQERGRLVLRVTWAHDDRLPYRRWDGKVVTHYAEFLADKRAVFPTHHDSCSHREGMCWSFPLRHRDKLGEWLTHWFSAEQVSWLEPAREQMEVSNG